MEEELAAVEEDVERKRVSKNPFEQKFTALVRTPQVKKKCGTSWIHTVAGQHVVQRGNMASPRRCPSFEYRVCPAAMSHLLRAPHCQEGTKNKRPYMLNLSFMN